MNGCAVKLERYDDTFYICIENLSAEEARNLHPKVTDLVLGFEPQPKQPPQTGTGFPQSSNELVSIQAMEKILAFCIANGAGNNKINLIKFTREMTLWGLKDSKDCVDNALAKHNGQQSPYWKY